MADKQSIRILAGEYALGVLPYEERLVFEARLKTDAEARMELAFWQERLGQFADEIDAARPSRNLLPEIETCLFGRDIKPPFWRRAIWPSFAMLAAGVAAFLIVDRNTFDREPVIILPQSELVAALQNSDIGLDIIGAYDVEAGSLRLTKRGGTPLATRVYELWLIAGDAAPISLGVLPDTPHIEVDIPADLRPLLANGALAISDEPEGGSPTGQPTGDVLAVGGIAEI